MYLPSLFNIVFYHSFKLSSHVADDATILSGIKVFRPFF